MEHKQIRIALDRKARLELNRLLDDGNTPQKIVKRARIVLMNAAGCGVSAIMREVGVSKTTVWRWQEYFIEAGVAGLVKGRSKPPGRKPLSRATKLAVVEKTVKERPANATHWSLRAMAEEIGISHTSVQRIWAEHDLKAASGAQLQGFQRSRFRHQGRRHRRSLSQPAGESACAFGR